MKPDRRVNHASAPANGGAGELAGGAAANRRLAARGCMQLEGWRRQRGSGPGTMQSTA